MHTDEGGVSVAPVNSSMAEVSGGDEHFELIEGAVDILSGTAQGRSPRLTLKRPRLTCEARRGRGKNIS